MIEVRPAEPKAPEFKGYKKGTLIQSTKVYDHGRNIYLVVGDSPLGHSIHTIRLVDGGSGPSQPRLFEMNYHISHELVEPFNGELVIKNG